MIPYLKHDLFTPFISVLLYIFTLCIVFIFFLLRYTVAQAYGELHFGIWFEGLGIHKFNFLEISKACPCLSAQFSLSRSYTELVE